MCRLQTSLLQSLSLVKINIHYQMGDLCGLSELPPESPISVLFFRGEAMDTLPKTESSKADLDLASGYLDSKALAGQQGSWLHGFFFHHKTCRRAGSRIGWDLNVFVSLILYFLNTWSQYLSKRLLCYFWFWYLWTSDTITMIWRKFGCPKPVLLVSFARRDYSVLVEVH